MMQNVTSASIALLLAVGLTACQRERNETEAAPSRAVDTTVHAARSTPMTEPSPVNQPSPAAKTSVADLGSCQPSTDVSAMASRLADLADANGDGKVSRDEARSAMNFIVGGAFFRADANGDGKITPEEGRQARTELTNRYPALGALITESKKTTGQSPFRSLARVLDIDYGKTLSIEDARQAVGGATDDLFKAADRNHDGTITRDEAINAGWDQARTVAADAFTAADGNKDGYINASEFQTVVNRSSKPLFDLADGNKDGKLSQKEAAVAMNTVVERLGIPGADANATAQGSVPKQ